MGRAGAHGGTGRSCEEWGRVAGYVFVSEPCLACVQAVVVGRCLLPQLQAGKTGADALPLCLCPVMALPEHNTLP